MTLCSNPLPALEAHEIPENGRKVSVAMTINWADDRGEFSKTLPFCSFACAAAYFVAKAEQHDPEGL